MTEDERVLLIYLAEKYYSDEKMELVTHKDVGMSLDDYNTALCGLIRKGYLPNGEIVKNKNGKDIYFSGEELSDYAKEIIDRL